MPSPQKGAAAELWMPALEFGVCAADDEAFEVEAVTEAEEDCVPDEFDSLAEADADSDAAELLVSDSLDVAPDGGVPAMDEADEALEER